jgi:hypothetical protein
VALWSQLEQVERSTQVDAFESILRARPQNFEVLRGHLYVCPGLYNMWNYWHSSHDMRLMQTRRMPV